jgi:competence protein ComEA
MNSRQETLLTVILGASCLLLACWHVWPRLFPAFTPVLGATPALTVAIDGAVNRPGTYRLEWGARVADLLELAGGLQAGAESSLVNPAALLTADEAVFVPWARTAAGDSLTSLNSAHAWELERLPGVGPALAARIEAGRPYAEVDDLIRVSGIGEITLERIRPLVKP